MVTISLYPSEKNTTYKITKNKSSTSNPDLAQSTRLWKRNCGKSLQVQLSLPWLCCLILGQSHSRNLAFLEGFFFFLNEGERLQDRSSTWVEGPVNSGKRRGGSLKILKTWQTANRSSKIKWRRDLTSLQIWWSDVGSLRKEKCLRSLPGKERQELW